MSSDNGLVASPPASTKTSLGQKLRERARQRWPQLAGIGVRFRGQFAYVTGKLPDGSELPLCRLRYVGYASVDEAIRSRRAAAAFVYISRSRMVTLTRLM